MGAAKSRTPEGGMAGPWRSARGRAATQEYLPGPRAQAPERLGRVRQPLWLTPARVCPMRNVHNVTCFVNASMQVLLRVSLFVRLIQRHGHDGAAIVGCRLCALSELAVAVARGDPVSQSGVALYEQTVKPAIATTPCAVHTCATCTYYRSQLRCPCCSPTAIVQ